MDAQSLTEQLLCGPHGTAQRHHWPRATVLSGSRCGLVGYVFGRALTLAKQYEADGDAHRSAVTTVGGCRVRTCRLEQHELRTRHRVSVKLAVLIESVPPGVAECGGNAAACCDSFVSIRSPKPCELRSWQLWNTTESEQYQAGGGQVDMDTVRVTWSTSWRAEGKKLRKP